ncbi:MAG: imidazole glycerol phosphate synthase subunit HisH, partial [Sporomusa sp.]
MSVKKTIAIVDYGMGNLLSVSKAFEYIGCKTIVSQDAHELLRGDHLVVPGVGAFPQAIEQLRSTGLIDFIKQSVDSGVPTLGICLGMQLFFDGSDEGGVHQGLELFHDHMTLMDMDDCKIPHMGWNKLSAKDSCP